MRQLTYVAPNQLEWWDVPAPRLEGGGQALVEPIAVTRCDLDYSIVTGAIGWRGPFSLGHEMVGVVREIGDAVRNVRPGDRVIVPFQISCGECAECRCGHTGSCSTVRFRSSYGMAPLAGYDYGGALSDLLRVPYADHMLVPCPAGLAPAAAATLSDAYSDAYRSVVPYMTAAPEARVLIVGGAAQSLGLYCAQIAQALGAAEVVYLDDDPLRLKIARSLAVQVVERTAFDGTAPGAPFPITIDASNSPDGLALAIRSTAHGGTCHRTFGDVVATTPVPLRHMYSIGLNLHLSRVHARTVMSQVLEHMGCGRLRPQQVITRTVPFSEAVDAMFDRTVKVAFINETSVQ